MSLKLVRGRRLPIGVDLGTRSVKLAQLRCCESDFELLAAGAAELPDNGDGRSARPETLTDLIRKVLKSDQFRGQKSVLSLPAEETSIQPVRVPKVPSDRLGEAVRLELEGKLAYPVSQAIVRHVVAGDIYGDSEPKQEVIAMCTSRRTLDSYLSLARRAKLDVVGVNVKACAIVECFSRLFRRASDSGRTILFVDLGWTTTQAVLSHGNNIVFARNVSIGDKQMDEALAEGMNVPVGRAHSLRRDLLAGAGEGLTEDEVYRHLADPVAKLVDQLTGCLRYYESVFPNRTVELAIFVGGGACDKRLCQSIAERLALPAQIGDPLLRMGRAEGAAFTVGLDRRQAQPAWAVAVGLSLGAAQAT